MSWQDNPITKAFDSSFYIVQSEAMGLPYSVVPLSIDPMNRYSFDEVAAFWAALPDGDPQKLIGEDQTQVPPPPPTDDEIMAGYKRQVASRLNSFAVARGYENVLDCVSYYHSSRTQKAADANYVVTARDATWLVWESIEKNVEDGAISVPASWAEVETLLPTLTWPTA